MDVLLPLNDIEIRNGLKGYKRRSSMFCAMTGVVGLSAFIYTFAILILEFILLVTFEK